MAITIAADVTVDQAAYNLATDYALRPELFFDRLCDVKPTAQDKPGSSVIFNFTDELSVSTTPLDESTDVTPVSMGDSQATVTIHEQGNAVKTTARLRGTSYVVPYDSVVANVIGYNAGVTLDTTARGHFEAGDNVLYATGGATTPTARNTVEPEDTLASDDFRKVKARLAAASVATFGGYYAAIIHPDTFYDLRRETGTAAWRDPHVYSQPAEIWNGEAGEYEGFRIMVSPRAPLFADAGSSTTLTDVYGSLFMGRQSMAKAWSFTDGNGPQPRIVPGPVTDTLRRFVPLGWYSFLGYGRYREAALWRVESASSIGTNA